MASPLAKSSCAWRWPSPRSVDRIAYHPPSCGKPWRLLAGSGDDDDYQVMASFGSRHVIEDLPLAGAK